MNQALEQLYHEYMTVTSNPVAAATMVLADIMAKEKETVFIECDDPHSLDVKQTAARLKISSKEVYRLILRDQLKAFSIGQITRISIDEIERYEAENPAPAKTPGTSLQPRDE